MARTLTYNLTEHILPIVDAHVLAKRFTSQWPVNQKPEEEGGSTASNTINVNQYTLHENHPLASLFGKYEDEPLWDGFEEAIRRLREEDNAIIE